MPVNAKADKTYKVRDIIYGFVKLDAQEMDIVNSPYYQRLRRIRQLSLTEMVYPGANHTRFEHSLGVVQMATEMFDSIINRKENCRMLGIEKDALARTRKIVRLAALLHDIGHAPFSHSGEGSMPFLSLKNPRYDKNKPPNEQKRYEHEDYSIAAIKLIFREYIEKHPTGEALGIKAEDVSALLGDETVAPTRTTLLWKELISGQLDADRADYLLRDSIHLGVSYGMYDRNRLINCITLGRSEEFSDCFLAIEDGGWHVAESLVIARYQMFSQVYFHPVRRAFDYHIEQATKEVLKNLKFKDALFPQPTSRKNVEKYLGMDDWTVYGALKGKKGGVHGEIVLNREPFKCRKEWDGEPSEEELKQVGVDLSRYDGFLDKGASTKWYKLDKDIRIFNASQNSSYQLSYKSKLIQIMPGLPKTTRLFISQQGKGSTYEFKL